MSIEYDSSDTGDLTTVNSYNNFDYGNEIPILNRNREVDMIDYFDQECRSTLCRMEIDLLSNSWVETSLVVNTVQRMCWHLMNRCHLTIVTIFLELIESILIRKDSCQLNRVNLPDNPGLPDEVSA